jgi:DNA helicase-2/ATP-dependent DNA helicase PcrA
MYRTNAQSRALEEALMSRGLRYQIIGGTRFYARKEIKDVLAYLRLVANPFDAVSLSRILNWPARGIGERRANELFAWANDLGVPVFQALRELDDPQTTVPFAKATRTVLRGFLTLAETMIEARQQLELGALIDHVLDHVAVRQELLREYGPDEGEDRWNNVQELRNVAGEYANLPIDAQFDGISGRGGAGCRC